MSEAGEGEKGPLVRLKPKGRMCLAGLAWLQRCEDRINARQDSILRARARLQVELNVHGSISGERMQEIVGEEMW